ncbi:helix-turn-helix domain-containing protein [Azospirillum sp. SYSU D00513]|uniref:excisionase family DNA-binding protein n=1 Tax=Azospirillum sp. SYSU D00513 TaxID=2812561 RepID=UPI001A966AFE
MIEEKKELSPTEASELLGISRPLVMRRMDEGDLPFHSVGTQRRCKREDVLALKAREEERQRALDALADDNEDLMGTHGLE